MLEKTKRYFKSIKPIILSHHPLCEPFSDGTHTMELFGKEWCIGCFVTYPMAILVLVFGSLFDIFQPFLYWELFHIGFSLCGVYIFSILGLTKKKPVKIISKVIIGWGIAFCIAAIWKLPFGSFPKIILSYLYVMIGHLFINAVRGYSIYKTCKTCEFYQKGNVCPGMEFMSHSD